MGLVAVAACAHAPAESAPIPVSPPVPIEPGCAAPPALAPELAASARLGSECGRDASCWRAGLDRARATRDRFAAGYDAHRAYVLTARGAARVLGEAALEPVLAEYRALSAAAPDDPAYRHLLAQLTLDGETYQAELERLAASAPDYPWAQLSLAYRAQAGAPEPALRAARAGYERFAALCPDRRAERLGALERLADAELWRRESAGLRDAARAALDLESLARVWALDLRLSGAADRPTARATAGREATELLAAVALRPVPAEELAWLLRGAEIARDDVLRADLEERLLAVAPCSVEASRIAARRAESASAPPAAADRIAHAAWRSARLAETERRLELCPRDELALRRQVELLGRPPIEEPDRLLAAFDRFLALPPARPPADLLPAFSATRYLAWNLRLERVPELLAEDERRIGAALERAPSEADPLASARAEARRRENLRLSVRYALAVGDLASTERRIGELEDATASAPGGGRDQPLPGAGLFPDERSQLDRLEAEWHLAAGEPEAALDRLERLVLDPAVGPHVDELARAAFRAARGSEEAYESWRGDAARGAEPSEWRAIDRAPPPVGLTSFSGGAFDWTALRGRTLLVGVWTTWCSSCPGFLEAMNRLAASVGERRDVALVAVDADRTGGAIVPFLADRELAYEVVIGGDAFFDHGLDAVPMAWIVDPSGRIVRERQGFDGDADAWAAAALGALETVAGAGAP